MKRKITTGFLLLLLAVFTALAFSKKPEIEQPVNATTTVMDSVLRHVVLFKFKPETTETTLKKIETTFSALPSKIDLIQDFEWGLNNSPEGLNKDFTHCYLLSFKSEADRDAYLPHPDHQAFVAIIKDYVADVLVVDYWAKE